MTIGGVGFELSPPFDGWSILEYLPSGGRAGATLHWDGPSGFYDQTLIITVADVALDSEAAWDRVEALGQAGMAPHGVTWVQADQGVGLVVGREAEWREFRTPVLPPKEIPGFEDWYSVQDYLLDPHVWGNTSIRFYVVPVRGLTIKVAAYESRCACGASRSQRGGERTSDSEENELSQWIPELEASLAAMSFEAP